MIELPRMIGSAEGIVLAALLAAAAYLIWEACRA